MNLSICVDSKIIINSKINLDESTLSLYNSLKESGYNLFNKNDSFYNDVCSLYTSQNGTDMTLTDRKNEIFFNSGNISLCQTGCELKEFNSLTKYIKCDCQPQINEIEAILGSSDEKFIIEMFKDSIFTSIKNSNLLVLKCYKLAFDTSTLLKNYGRIFMTAIIALSLIFFLITIFIEFKKFDSFLITILNNNINNCNQNYGYKKINKKRMKKQKKIKGKETKRKNNAKGIEKVQSLKNKLILNNHNKFKLGKKKYAPPIKRNLSLENSSKKNEKSSFENNLSSKNFIKDYSIKNKRLNIKLNKRINNNTNINIIKIKNVHLKKYLGKKKDLETKPENIYKKSYLNNNKMARLNKNKDIDIKKKLYDEELNSLEYIQAIELDKRTFSQYYFSLIKKKQLILFTFFRANDYNLFSVKICLFLTNFSLYLTMNCFFLAMKQCIKFI